MNVIDSSVWLEYFADTKYVKPFLKVIDDQKNSIVPTIILYEVFKKVLSERDHSTALNIAAHMQLGRIVDFNFELALIAARLSKEHQLPMADSIVLATARKYNATVWTMDADFKGLPGVKYFKK